MSTPLRLALVLVIVTLGATLALLATGDATDARAAVRQLRNRLYDWLAPVPARATEKPDTSVTVARPAAKPLEPATIAAPGGNVELRRPPSFDRHAMNHAEHAPANTSQPAIESPRPAVANEFRASPIPAESLNAPRYVTAWPEMKSRSGGTIRLAAADDDDFGPAFRSGRSEIKELFVKNQDITTVLELLAREGQRNIVASRNVRGPLSITLYNTTVDDALAAILKMQGLVARQEGDYLRVYTPEDLEEAEAQSGRIAVRIYKPRYISATDLVNILTTHLTSRGKISSTKPNQIGIASSSDNAGGDALAVDDAVVVQDVESALQRIEAIIAQVDIRPPQVLIEATVLRVELNDNNQMGVNFAAFSGHSLSLSGQGSLIDNAAGFTPSVLVDGLGQVRDGFVDGTHGLKFGVVRGDLTAFVKLLETVGHTTLVASPKVLALNKQRAEIIVGAQLGYRTVTTTETAAVENIQFLEVGTQLRLRPFVQADGMIRLELHPEKSSGKVSESTGLPEKATTQVTTNLTVPSGTTVVIGGLIEEEQQRSVQQVPFLGSLPLVGALFRDETTSTRRQEIIVLITPRVVDEQAWDCEARREMDLFEARRDTLDRSFPSYTRVALARKYFEKARFYRDHGDVATARKMAELSVHFDPTNESAVHLYDELRWAPHDESHHQLPDESPGEPSAAPALLSPAPAAATPKSPPAAARKERRDRLTR